MNLAIPTELEGRCLCGQVMFTARPFGDAGACHCKSCRRWSGGIFIGVQLAGAPRFANAAPLGIYQSSQWGERVFCRECGASLVWRTQDGHHQVASVQCFDEPWHFRLSTEIYIDEKPDSYALAGEHKTVTGAEVIAAVGKEEG